jgi:hypothetical protein
MRGWCRRCGEDLTIKLTDQICANCSNRRDYTVWYEDTEEGKEQERRYQKARKEQNRILGAIAPPSMPRRFR